MRHTLRCLVLGLSVFAAASGLFAEAVRSPESVSPDGRGPLLYCPDNPNTRAQMAVAKTFSLSW